MIARTLSFSRWLIGTALLATLPSTVAISQELTDEPDKTMAAAQQSFIKKDTKTATEHLQKSAAYVRKEADKVAKSSQAGLKKAGDQLAQLGKDVTKGAVKSADDMAKVFAKVDYERAKAWHATAAQAKKSGKDATDGLKQAGAALNGAAQWSGAQLKQGTTMAVESVKKIGQGAKLGAEETEKMFKSLGEGVEDLGRHLARP